MKQRPIAVFILLLFAAAALLSAYRALPTARTICYLKEETSDIGDRKVYTLDRSNRISIVQHYNKVDLETGHNAYTYNMSGRLLRIAVYDGDRLWSITEYTYKGGRLIGATLSMQEDRRLMPRNRSEYEYNAQGHISRIVTYAGVLLKTPLFLHDFEYDKKGNLTKHTKYVFEKGNTVAGRKLKGTALLEATRILDEITEYTYDDKVHPLSIYNLPDIAVSGTAVNNILTEIRKDKEGKIKLDLTYQYEYNSYNLPVSKTAQYSSGTKSDTATFVYDCR